MIDMAGFNAYLLHSKTNSSMNVKAYVATIATLHYLVEAEPIRLKI
jgi:hypothetical protein